MRKVILLGAMAAMLATPALAWSTDPTMPRARATATGGGGGGGGSGTGTATASGGTSTSGGNTLTASGGRETTIIPPSFSGAGQCTPVGIGPTGGGPGGGGGGLVTWESTNCRNYWIAVTLIEAGKREEGLRLLASITDKAHDAIYPEATNTSPVLPVVAAKPEWCATASAGELRRHAECH